MAARGRTHDAHDRVRLHAHIGRTLECQPDAL